MDQSILRDFEPDSDFDPLFHLCECDTCRDNIDLRPRDEDDVSSDMEHNTFDTDEPLEDCNYGQGPGNVTAGGDGNDASYQGTPSSYPHSYPHSDLSEAARDHD